VIDTLKNDLKVAMKARDKTRVSTLRMIISTAQNEQIAKGSELTAEDFVTLLTRQAKQRRESAEQFRAGDREEMAAQEEAELLVIQDYLPKQMSEDEVKALIAELIATTGAEGPRGMGKVMGPLSGKIKGKFDGKRASALVREALA
jgi:uncharacterized protein